MPVLLRIPRAKVWLGFFWPVRYSKLFLASFHRTFQSTLGKLIRISSGFAGLAGLPSETILIW